MGLYFTQAISSLQKHHTMLTLIEIIQIAGNIKKYVDDEVINYTMAYFNDDNAKLSAWTVSQLDVLFSSSSVISSLPVY